MNNVNLSNLPNRAWQRFVLALIVFTCPLVVLVFRGMSADVLVRFFPDDAFYYLQIGSNIWHRGLVSFDGINTTTGFHPLNQLLAALAVGGFGKTGALIFYMFFNALASAVAVWLIAESLHLSAKALLLAAAVMLLPLFDFYLVTSGGMESPLMLVCFAGVASSLIQVRDWSAVRSLQAVKLGAWVGLLVLARLDMVVPLLCIAPLVVFHACRHHVRAGAKWLLLCAAVAGVLVVPYLLWMVQAQGNVMPISSIAKYGRPAWALSQVWLTMTGGNLIGATLLLFYAVAPIALIVAARREWATPTGQFFLAFGASGLVYWAYVMFVAHEPFKWYLNYCAFTCLVLLMWYVAAVQKRFDALHNRFAVGAAIGSVIVAAGLIGYWSGLETTSFGLYQTTLQLNRLIPAGQTIATNDAGTIGYFSSSAVHNLDGLVNSKQNYDQFLKQQDYIGYIKKYDVNYLLLRPEMTTRTGQDGVTQSEFPAASTLIESIDVPRFGKLVLVKVN